MKNISNSFCLIAHDLSEGFWAFISLNNGDVDLDFVRFCGGDAGAADGNESRSDLGLGFEVAGQESSQNESNGNDKFHGNFERIGIIIN